MSAPSLAKTISFGTFWYSINTLLTKVIGLATMFFILRALSVYEYGLVELALAGIAVLSFFRLPGLSSVVLSDMARAKGDKDLAQAKGLLTSYTKTQLGLGLSATLLIFFGASFIASFYEGQITVLLKIVSFTFFLSALRTTYTTLFGYSLRFFIQSLHTFFEEFSKLLLVLLCVVYLQMGTTGLVLAMVLSQAMALFILLPWAWQTYKPLRGVVSRKVSIVGIIRTHGKWSIVTSYVNDFSQTARIWLLRFFLGTEAVGLFAAAQGLFSHTVALVPLNQVMLPLIPQYFSDKERFKKIVASGIKYQFIAYFGLGIVAWFFFPPLIAYLFPKYIPSLPLFRIMLFSFVGVSVATMLTPVFYAAKAQKNYLESILVKLTSTLLLTPVLISTGLFVGGVQSGLFGAAWEYVLTLSITALERLWAVGRVIPDFKDLHKSFFHFDQYDRIVWQKIKEQFKKYLPRYHEKNY